MFQSNHLIGFGAVSAASGRTVTYVTQLSDGTDAASYTFTGASIGTAAADRVVVVGVWVRSLSAVNFTSGSLTIGGVSATRLSTAAAGAGPGASCALYALNVAAGTTANIVVTPSASSIRCAIAIWTVTGSTSVTTSDTISANTGSPAITGTLTIPIGGVGIAVAGDGQGTTQTCTWTGMTERFDTGVEAVNAFTGGDSSTPGATQTVTATFSGATSDPVLAAASFGP